MSIELILDECGQNLFYAEESMREWIPVSEYEIIFEAGINQDVKEKITKNEETANKTTGFVQKAINAVIKLIAKVLRPIQEFIARFTMSGKEREAYEKFKAAMEKDPKLKNRKISVLDFRKINATYDSLLKEIEQNIKSVKANESHSIDEITDKVTKFLSGTSSAVAVIVGADLALKMADSNIEMAKKLKNLLENENSVMKTLSETLGKKDAANLKKEIDAAAKNTMLHQLKVRLFRHKYDSLEECVNGIFNAFTHLGLDTLTMINRARKNEYTKPIVNAVAKGELELGKQKLKNKKDAAINKVKGILPSKPVKPQKTDGVHAPLSDFVTGKNKKN